MPLSNTSISLLSKLPIGICHISKKYSLADVVTSNCWLYPGFKILFPCLTITLWLLGLALYGILASVNAAVLPSPVNSVVSILLKESTELYTAKLITLLSAGALPNINIAFGSFSVLSPDDVIIVSTVSPSTVT